MTATFDPTLLTPLDRVRRAVGDTNVDAPLRSNEEILSVLARLSGDEPGAIAEISAGLAVEYAQRPDSINDDGTAIRWGERVKTWLSTAEFNRGLAVTIATGSGEAESIQLIRRGYDPSHAEYDPNRVDPSW